MKIKNLFELALLLRSALKKAKWSFNQYGFPVFPKDVFLDSFPCNVEPIQRLRCCEDPASTLLCSFADDQHIQTRLQKLFDEINLYKRFVGFGGFDLSPRIYWPLKRQRFNIWLSQLATAFVAMSGQKILPNFRIGNLQTLFALESYPKNIPYIVGTLGCAKRYDPLHAFIFKTKMLFTRPSHLLIYGHLRKEYEKLLQELGIPYTLIPDFRTRCYTEYLNRRAI